MTRLVCSILIAAALATIAIVAYRLWPISHPDISASSPASSPQTPSTAAAKPTSSSALTTIPLRYLGRYRKVSGEGQLQTLEITSTTLTTIGPKFGSPGELNEEHDQPTKIVQRPDDSLALTIVIGDLTWTYIIVLTDAGLAFYREAEGTTIEIGRFERY